PEGVRAAGVPARGRGPGGLRRGTAGPGVGRSSRPIYHRGQDNDPAPAGQARRAARDPHRPRGRLPDRRTVMTVIRKALAAVRTHWRSLRLQLALLYGGAFVALGLALLAVSGLLVRSTSRNFFSGRAIDLRPALVLLAAVVVAVALGWLIAGRFLRPLCTITRTARDISASNLSRRLSITGRDAEFAELGETLDDLFARLEASFQAQRHFVAN